jgi:hypothetical protein
MFWKSKPTPIETCAQALYEALTKALTQNGRIHVEDLISAAAAIVGEACIETAGDFNPPRAITSLLPADECFLQRLTI